MKKLLFFLILFTSLKSIGQPTFVMAPNPQVINFINGGLTVLKNLQIPFFADTIFGPSLGNNYKKGSIGLLLTDSTFVFYTGKKWVKLKPSTGSSDSSIFATQYRLDTTRNNLYSAISAISVTPFDSTYIYQALDDTAAAIRGSMVGGGISQSDLDDSTFNIRSDLSDSLALRVYLIDSNIIYITPTDLQDTALAIRGDFPVTDSSLFATQYRLDTTRTGIDSRINLRVKYSDSNTVYIPKYGIDTARTTLNTNISTRVKYTDTASMLSPYLRAIDTSSLSSRINSKLSITDTSSMLSVYLKEVDTTSMLLPYLRKVDTSTLSSRINLKLNTADSTTAYVTPKRLADTATVLRGLIPTVPTLYYQTVKRNGVGYTQQPTLDFSTQFALNDNIGTSATDVSVSALAQSVVTGLTDSLNSRVRYVDTSGMLSPYLREVDTSTLSSRINLKLSITDTTAMLSPYLREVDTSTLSSRINLKADLASPAFTGNVTITNTTDISLGSESALRVGGAANSTNIAMGEYNSALGIQARNNGTSANLFLQGDGGGVAVGNGALTGQRIFAINNTGTGTGDYSAIEIRTGSAGTDALRLYTLCPNFVTSGSNHQDGVAITSGTGLSGGMSIGTLANATFRVFSNNIERWVLDGSGNTIITGKFTSSGGGLGYSTGAGGTVTQITSKSTGVTLNKLSGQITLNNASLAANGEAVFTLTNSFIESTDVVAVCLGNSVSAGRYMVGVATVSAGSCQIIITNLSSVATEAPVINFVVIKGVNN